jgi:hypothetical protein
MMCQSPVVSFLPAHQRPPALLLEAPQDQGIIKKTKKKQKKRKKRKGLKANGLNQNRL